MGRVSWQQLETEPGGIAAADILSNSALQQTVSAAQTTLITIPAGRTWVGVCTIQCACSEDAAGAVAASAKGVIAITGVTVTPAAGNLLECDAQAAANTAASVTGTQGAATVTQPVTVSAGTNVATLTFQPTIVGTRGIVNFMATGLLV